MPIPPRRQSRAHHWRSSISTGLAAATRGWTRLPLALRRAKLLRSPQSRSWLESCGAGSSPTRDEEISRKFETRKRYRLPKAKQSPECPAASAAGALRSRPTSGFARRNPELPRPPAHFAPVSGGPSPTPRWRPAEARVAGHVDPCTPPRVSAFRARDRLKPVRAFPSPARHPILPQSLSTPVRTAPLRGLPGQRSAPTWLLLPTEVPA